MGTVCPHLHSQSPFLLFHPGGPYGVFAGRDASRGLATFSLTEEAIKDEYDDLSDLNSMQMESIREWEMQFTGKQSSLTCIEHVAICTHLYKRCCNSWSKTGSYKCTLLHFFPEKYDYVGRLLKAGEEPTDYTDTEEESLSGQDKSKDD